MEGVRAELAEAPGWSRVADAGHIAVLVDPGATVLRGAGAAVVVDAIMAKTNTGTTRAEGAVVIALGPGFTAGEKWTP